MQGMLISNVAPRGDISSLVSISNRDVTGYHVSSAPGSPCSYSFVPRKAEPRGVVVVVGIWVAGNAL
jgi:hypothetical protein